MTTNERLTIEAIRLILAEIPQDDRHDTWLDTSKELAETAAVETGKEPLDVKRLQGLRNQARQMAGKLLQPDAEDRLGKEGLRAHGAKALHGVADLVDDTLATDETARKLAEQASEPIVDTNAPPPADDKPAPKGAAQTQSMGVIELPTFRPYTADEEALAQRLEAKPAAEWSQADTAAVLSVIYDDQGTVRGSRGEALRVKYNLALQYHYTRLDELADPATPYDAAWTKDAIRILGTERAPDVTWMTAGTSTHAVGIRWLAEELARTNTLWDADATWINDHRDELPAHLRDALLARIAPPPPAYDPHTDGEIAAANRLIKLPEQAWTLSDHALAAELVRDAQGRVRGELATRLESKAQATAAYRTRRLQALCDVDAVPVFDDAHFGEVMQHLDIQDPDDVDPGRYGGFALIACMRFRAEHILRKPAFEAGDASWMIANQDKLPEAVNERFRARTRPPVRVVKPLVPPQGDSLPPPPLPRSVRPEPVTGPFPSRRPPASNDGRLPPTDWQPENGAARTTDPEKVQAKRNTVVAWFAGAAVLITLVVLIFAMKPTRGPADAPTPPSVAMTEPTVDPTTIPTEPPAPPPVVQPTPRQPRPAPVATTRTLTAADVGVDDLSQVNEGQILPSRLSRIVGTPRRTSRNRLDYSGLQWRLPAH